MDYFSMPASVQSSVFASPQGAREIFLMLQTRVGGSFSQALEQIQREYSKVCVRLRLSPETLVFARVYLSDIANQQLELCASSFFAQLSAGAVGFVQQRPLASSQMAALAYHVKPGKEGNLRKSLSGTQGGGTELRLLGRNYRMVFTAGVWNGSAPENVREQTRGLFAALDDGLQAEGMSLRNDNLRTWIFLGDVDREYGSMVAGRNDFFAASGWKDGARYPASTGIGGGGPGLTSRVCLDSLSLGGLRPEQIRILEAPSHMPPAMRYGVAFERGLKIQFGDRAHFHVSGTASIDPEGNILHLGDAVRQTDRSLDNIRALLQSQGADFQHMAYWIVYLRNPADYAAVFRHVRKRISAEVPCLFLESPVCRPGWLVEIEGWAVKPEKSAFPVFL